MKKWEFLKIFLIEKEKDSVLRRQMYLFIYIREIYKNN